MTNGAQQKRNSFENDYALNARLKSTVFSSRLKALWFVILWSDVGSEFHAAGPANAKLRFAQLETSCWLFIASTARRTKSVPRYDTGGRCD